MERRRVILILIAMLCLLPAVLSARERNYGDKMKLPENTEFAKKVNEFLAPVSFGVGTEPGYNKNSVYLYLMYDYLEDCSWMAKFKIENTTNSQNELDSGSDEEKFMQVNKSKSYELYIQPWIRHFEYTDFGLGLFLGYYQYDFESVYNSNNEGMFFEGTGRLSYAGPLLTLQMEYPIFSHVDIGMTTELIPISMVWYNYDCKSSFFTQNDIAREKDSDSMTGFSAASLEQNLYVNILKFIHLSTFFSYEYLNAGNSELVIHETIWRVGTAILKRPKSGFMNFLVGIYYENEWEKRDQSSFGKNWTHENRWLFCIGASG